MDVDWMILANYAEAPPDSGLLNMIGGGWDTIQVAGPLEGLPPEAVGVVAVMQGSLAARILFHSTELGRDRTLQVVIVDEDGLEVAKIEGGFRSEKQPGVPPSWPQGVNVVFPLQGLGLNKFGLYRISLLVDGQHLGDREFRVLKLY